MEILVIVFCGFVALVTADLEPPTVQPLLIPPDLKLGDALNLMCNLQRGSLPVNFRWYKDGHEILGESGAKITSVSKRTSMFAIEELKSKDVGNYTCSVRNEAGFDSSTVLVMMEVPPEWVIEPSDVVAPVGARIKVDCSATGFPSPRILWRKVIEGERTPVTLATNQRRIVSNNGTFTIASSKLEDGGTYQCDVYNRIGQGLRKKINLDVHIPPEVRAGEAPESAKKGGVARLVCRFTGNGTFVTSWHRDNDPSFEHSPRVEVYRHNQADGLESELYIRGVDSPDTGSYTCKGTTRYGTAQAIVTLTVLEPASAPRSVRVNDVTTNSARVLWRRPATGAPNSYVIRYWQADRNGRRLFDFSVPAIESTVMLKDLKSGNPYVVSVLAENEAGLSEASEPTSFRTLDEVPQAPPTDVQMEGMTSTEIVISFKSPPRESWNGELEGFYIGYKVKESSLPYALQRVTISGTEEDDRQRITGLQKGKVYLVNVKCFNSAGAGPPTPDLTIALPAEDPPSPPALAVTDITKNSADINWNKPPSDKNIKHYELQMKSVSKKDWTTYHVPSKKTTFRLYGLLSSHRYEVQMAAVNDFGRGRFSAKLTFTTTLKGVINAVHHGTSEEERVFLRPYVVIPVVLSIAVIITSLIMGWLCFKKTKIESKQLNTIWQDTISRKNKPHLTHTLRPASTIPRPLDYREPAEKTFEKFDDPANVTTVTVQPEEQRATTSYSPAESSASYADVEDTSEAVYDTPWDGSNQKGLSASGSYTKLKNGLGSATTAATGVI